MPDGFIGPSRLAFGSGFDLERAVARLLEHAGFTDVALVGGSGDGGADVLGIGGGQRWLVQCKYRGSGQVDSSAGREAVAAMSQYDAQVAVAACNQTFTTEAYRHQANAISHGIDLRLWDGAYLTNYVRHANEASISLRTLHKYQQDAVAAVEWARGRGASAALVLMATGLGKSLVAAELAASEVRRNPSQAILVLAHTVDLVRQLDRSFWCQLPKSVSTHVWADSERPRYSGGIVFGTWQTVLRAAGGHSQAGRFGLVLVDEAHHAPSQSYSSLLQHLSPNFMVGFTATPWRGDGVPLDDLFGAPVFSMDLIDGMQRGYLADVDYQLMADSVDWDELARLSREGNTVQDLNRTLIVPERDIAMVQCIADHLKSRGRSRALGFCRSIEHAERLQGLLASCGVRTLVLHSRLERGQRFRALSMFRCGTIDMLLSVEMLNEGIDVPQVDLIAFMRVTHSRRIFVQQLGRGLRLAPGKSNVLILDFVADIRRLAAALAMNREARDRAKGVEVVRYRDGEIVKFIKLESSSFFRTYIDDVARMESCEDSAVIRFPSISGGEFF